MLHKVTYRIGSSIVEFFQDWSKDIKVMVVEYTAGRKSSRTICILCYDLRVL